MEDFFNGLGNGLYNYEDFDIGMVRYLYKIYCWEKKVFIKGFWNVVEWLVYCNVIRIYCLVI